jgi:hypothetical protein
VRVRWVEHVAFKGGNKTHKKFGWGNLKERVHLKILGVDGRVI